MFRGIYCVIMSLTKIAAQKVLFYLGAQTIFCLYFPRLMSDLGEFQRKISARNAVELEIYSFRNNYNRNQRERKYFN
jgi:hypothetical protein